LSSINGEKRFIRVEAHTGLKGKYVANNAIRKRTGFCYNTR